MSIKPMRFLSNAKWLLLVMSVFLSSCSSIKLYVANSLAKTDAYQLSADISYGSDASQTLDVYSVNDAANAEPSNANVIIFYYGGCWGACTRFTKEDYRFVAESLVDEETVVIVPDYQRYPDVLFPTLMADASATVEWAKNNVAQYGGDPDRLFLMGHSSGAHMAVMLALNETYLPSDTYKRIRGVVGLAGPYDFLPLTSGYQKKLFGPEANYPASQPINFVDGSEPPLMLLHGGKDWIVKEKNMVNLSKKIEAAGGQVHTKLYKELSHSGIVSMLSIPLRDNATLREDVKTFVREQGLL